MAARSKSTTFVYFVWASEEIYREGMKGGDFVFVKYLQKHQKETYTGIRVIENTQEL